jgi:16S rRNA (guanine527-N7)-methyltransferase
MKRDTGVAAAQLLADRQAALALVENVSRETLDRLDRFVDLLLAWQPTINLIAPSTLGQVWTRHIADSLQLLAYAPDALRWVDLGSGAGFPGLVLACALVDKGGQVDLIESDSRKAAFLREAARVTGAAARVHNERIETFAERHSEPAHVITARALAPLPRLLQLAHPWLQRGAQGLFLKGQDVEAELTESAKSWHIESELLPSLTDRRAKIVRVARAEPRACGTRTQADRKRPSDP